MANTAFEVPSLRFAGNAAGIIPRRRFIKVTTTGLALAGAGEAASFVSMTETEKADEVLDVARGILMVEASAAIAIGAQVESAAAGKAVKKTTGIALGTAITSAAADGELIAILMI